MRVPLLAAPGTVFQMAAGFGHPPPASRRDMASELSFGGHFFLDMR
jgi:hypothetical protein